LRRRTRRHGRTLWRRSWTECRCGGPRHCRRRRRASHGGGRRGTGHGGRRRGTGHGGRRRRTGHSGGCRRSGRWCRWRGPSLLLGIRADARRDHGDTKKNAAKQTPRGSMIAAPW
jgi:hypothetical protein